MYFFITYVIIHIIVGDCMNEQMSKEQKNILVEQYINNIIEQLKANKMYPTEKQKKYVLDMYNNSDKSLEEIENEINLLAQQFIERQLEIQQKKEEYQRKMMEDQRRKNLEKIQKELEPKNIDDLNVEYKGITFNEQDIDLLLIANANNNEELQNAINRISNVNLKLDISETEDFQNIKQNVYNQYISSLVPKIEFFKNPNIRLIAKLARLTSSGLLTAQESHIFTEALQKNDIMSIMKYINTNFDKDKKHKLFEKLIRYSPIERSGIIKTEMPAYQRMYQEMQDKYNSITLDTVAKYGNVKLNDGKFDFELLKNALEFAKENEKEVRLNALIFYMDCPSNLYDLPVTEDNKTIVKLELANYVNQITTFIKNNGYEDTVRSIDVFNELLNRFDLKEMKMKKDSDGNTIKNPFEESYMYRGSIDQEKPVQDFDNIKSGWLKFLSIDDLCDIISIARNNLPNTDFMYNDDNLVDPKKFGATKGIIEAIQQYEEKNKERLQGKKLVDSIGVQMHIDNNTTKEQIVEMLNNLSSLGLPIEFTEFDLAMTNVEGLTENEIINLRNYKINQIIDAINECKDRDKIRGFTIWSKTDRQNFRVSLENEIRISTIRNEMEGIIQDIQNENKKEQPDVKKIAELKEKYSKLNNNLSEIKLVDTYHGGFYCNDMTNKKNEKNDRIQEFNYHTHTYRSGHSEYVSDKQMVEAAKRAGFTMLGFSEHAPFPEMTPPIEDNKMLFSEVDEYLESIDKLKTEYKDMTILSGFEAEYDPMQEGFLSDLRDRVDYMILGQHFIMNGMNMISQENNPEYPLLYAQMVCRGIDTGLFDIVAHPDCFMELRDKMIGEENQKRFIENSIIASNMICKKVVEMGIPLEINLGNAHDNKIMKDGKLGIPSELFWNIANKYEGLKVLEGVDAHSISALENVKQDRKLVENIVVSLGNKMIKGNYNPVTARMNNEKLKTARDLHRSSYTFEANLINYAVDMGYKTLDDNQNSESLAQTAQGTLNRFANLSSQNAEKKVNNIKKEIAEIDRKIDNNTATNADRMKKGRKEKAISDTYNAIKKQNVVLNDACQSINEAKEMGCETKGEYKGVVSLKTQEKTTKNPAQKQSIKANLDNFKQSKIINASNAQSTNQQKTQTISQEPSKSMTQPKTLKRVKTNPTNNNNNKSSKGFANLLFITFIVSFIIGLGIGIAYMMFKI